ncbi:MAG: phage tail assembly protein [Alphaproteobacteria bacterium]|nr:phage tail assembly protein [Alphaproteobacteria bacterium]
METYTLKHPVTDPDTQQELNTLTLRRPKVKDVKLAVQAAKGNDTDTAIHMISYIASISVAAVEELDLGDFAELSDRLGKLSG